MGFFRGKKQKEEKEEVPSLPELPKLPDFREFEDTEDYNEPFLKLPSYPRGEIGDSFSHNTIKDAVSGQKEVEDANESFKEKMHQSQNKNPLFVRIDKVETSLRSLDRIKENLLEVERILKKIEEVKDQEEKELKKWGDEIKHTKSKIEEISENLFSRI